VTVPIARPPRDYERDAAGLEDGDFVTANCLVRRAALEETGGFDERFSVAWREDSDLHFALLARGGRIVRQPTALVVHPVRPAPWGVSLRQQRKSLFNALLYKKYPDLYRKYIHCGPPWDYYAAVLALLAAVGAAVAGELPPLAFALGVWVTLTVRFADRRLRGTSREPGHVLEMLVTSALIPPLSVFWRLYGAFRFRVLFL
jgi:cellulose synthase/poly-beta-1,6-N-acetylglucosamine synthase-like glycosyltransferase